MSTPSLYLVLGVSASATADEIRQAYLSKSKQMHPDRFDQVKQRKEWDLANEKLKELNNAYSVLRDPAKRAQHDAELRDGSKSSGASGQTGAPHSQRRGPSVNLSRIRKGSFHFDVLPRTVQDALVRRMTDGNGPQKRIMLGGPGWLYFLALLLLLWPLLLINMSSRSQYSGGPVTSTSTIAVTLGIGFLQGLLLLRILKWRKALIRPSFIISPLYIIITGLDKVRYWPIWTLKSMSATHNYTNGTYTGTTVELELDSDKETIITSPQSEYESIRLWYRDFMQRAAAAEAAGDQGYFEQRNDFRDFDPAKAPPAPAIPFLSHIKKVAACMAAYLACLLVFILLDARKPSRPDTVQVMNAGSSNAYSPAWPVTPTPAAQPEPFPALGLPVSGQVTRFTNAEPLAPLAIDAPIGTNYYVKLVSTSTGQAVMTVFVRGGSSVEVSVPLGEYVLKYAAGETWYGPEHLFGRSTSFSKANQNLLFNYDGSGYNGHAIKLFKVRNGNLRTVSIRPGEF